MTQPSKQEITDFIKSKVSEISRIHLHEIDEHTEFANFGLDSVNGLSILQALEKYLNKEIDPLSFWNYPTIDSLSDHLETIFSYKS